ncbi:hypothetical protein L486_04302 [Kwoniella mangroviensis CBS 10435]|uniref:Uncharacterized protein n=1 Tax=Kwoniella mangroviensis CBS 10435 TaxID=1331196 RepID=A0A1B9IRY0_9TREE|nr:uncharacterized protein I203_02605 [Kwoniella mangroviensis CBS 8507]OCF58271.1 hypothetical protein L486_04302 [Kwoniella mangroviensis CBS 10435]OCF67947.1 hypothetical protein I203_02605 [Kwoniella mangroviensis CBS 8507]OCF78282.1 hypothetical protein I204_00220 [Kwoniella mangroviensis CBS 8886]
MSSSTSSTPNKSTSSSPTITPLHDPKHQAKVIAPSKPLGTANANIVPGQMTELSKAGAGLGQKALLAKRFAKANKPTVSPTDQLQSPCTAKLAGAKQRHFAKGKPASLAQSFTAIRDSAGAAPSTSASKNIKTDF